MNNETGFEAPKPWSPAAAFLRKAVPARTLDGGWRVDCYLFRD
jgi:hypothetical protein